MAWSCIFEVLHKLQKIATRALIHVTYRDRSQPSFIGFTPTNVHFVRKSLYHLLLVIIIMPPPLIGGVIKRWCCLTSVCLTSVAYIGTKSRTERPRKTIIGTEVAHVTRDSVTRTPLSMSKGQGHQTALLTAMLARQAAASVGVGKCWPWESAATLPSAWRREALRRHGARRCGAYRDGRPPTGDDTIWTGSAIAVPNPMLRQHHMIFDQYVLLIVRHTKVTQFYVQNL